MIDLKKFADLKQKAERLQTEIDRSAGARQQLLKQLKDEFDCDSLKEAKVLLKQLQKQEADAEEKFAEDMERFEKEYKECLEK